MLNNRFQGVGITGLHTDPPGAHRQTQDFFGSKTELSHLVVDETPGTWGKSLISHPINLVTTPHSPMCGSLMVFS